MLPTMEKCRYQFHDEITWDPFETERASFFQGEHRFLGKELIFDGELNYDRTGGFDVHRIKAPVYPLSTPYLDRLTLTFKVGTKIYLTAPLWVLRDWYDVTIEEQRAGRGRRSPIHIPARQRFTFEVANAYGETRPTKIGRDDLGGPFHIRLQIDGELAVLRG